MQSFWSEDKIKSMILVDVRVIQVELKMKKCLLVPPHYSLLILHVSEQ